MSLDIAELEEWFSERPIVVQELARRIFQTGRITPKDIQEVIVIGKRVAEDDAELATQPLPFTLLLNPYSSPSLRLTSISNIRGVNALAPRHPLEFGTESLTIIYGGNGSGKLGYVRLLKAICGGKVETELLGNAFEDAAVQQSCTISYDLSGKPQAPFNWNSGTNSPNELRSVSIYDSDCARVYVNKENEVTYEPALLTDFRLLIEACDEYSRLLTSEIAGRPSQKPIMPATLIATESGNWYQALNAETLNGDIEIHCDWGQNDQKVLDDLTQKRAEVNPAAKAKDLRATRTHLINFKTELASFQEQLSEATLSILNAARERVKTTRHAADIDAKKVFENQILDGVASESWKLMWEKAREYSQTEAYKGTAFPNTGEESRCVLCQQPLSAEAKTRMEGFEEYVRGSIEAEALSAEQDLAAITARFRIIPREKQLEDRLDLAHVPEQVRIPIRSLCESWAIRSNEILGHSAVVPTPASGPIGPPDETVASSYTAVGVNLDSLAAKLEMEALGFERTLDPTEQKVIYDRARELAAKKWVHEQKLAIGNDVFRLQQIKLLEFAKRFAKTTALSIKKSELADELVTSAFQSRFMEEIRDLGASRIPVDIIKTQTEKGHALHQIKLRNLKINAETGSILSDGEFRVVSIAAFVADVLSGGAGTPFVFDDPISSLDCDFEDSTAARLVELSRDRQVIIFTHRLSLLATLSDVAKKLGVAPRILALEREAWGAGEPNSLPPLHLLKPKEAINLLINEKLPQASKVMESEGKAAYNDLAKSLCGNIRIVVERLIEDDLLIDIVQRFRRAINSKGKLNSLTKINSEDCAFLDDMMSKYSNYEHAQPSESPIPLPEPAVIEADLKKLQAWQKEFKSRNIPLE